MEVVKFYIRANNNRGSCHIYVDTHTSMYEVRTLCGKKINHPYNMLYSASYYQLCKICSRIDDRDFNEIEPRSYSQDWIKFLPPMQEDKYFNDIQKELERKKKELERKKKEEISSLIFYYNEIQELYKLSPIKKDCPICLNEIEDNNLIILSCGHSFGIDCMKKLVRISLNCPICRESVTNNEAKYINII